MQHIFTEFACLSGEETVLCLLNCLFFCSQPFPGSGCLTDARLSMLNEVHVISLTGGIRGKYDHKETPQSSVFHFPALDTASPSPSHSVLFFFCTRQLLVFEMKDTCLAAFKESQNSESHLCCRAVHSPFYIQYGGADQKHQS